MLMAADYERLCGEARIGTAVYYYVGEVGLCSDLGGGGMTVMFWRESYLALSSPFSL